jgi:hypothetical protein
LATVVAMNGDRLAVRLRLHEQARSTWDDEAATELMRSLPIDPELLVTKDDLQRQVDLVRKDVEVQTALVRKDLESHVALVRKDVEVQTALVRKGLETHVALVRKDLEVLTGGVVGRIAAGEGRLAGQIQAAEARLGTEIERSARSTTKTTVFAVIAANVGMITSAVALAQILQ